MWLCDPSTVRPAHEILINATNQFFLPNIVFYLQLISTFYTFTADVWIRGLRLPNNIFYGLRSITWLCSTFKLYEDGCCVAATELWHLNEGTRERQVKKLYNTDICPLLDWSVGPPGGGKAPSSWLPTAETKKKNESTTSSIQTVVMVKKIPLGFWMVRFTLKNFKTPQSTQQKQFMCFWNRHFFIWKKK